MQDAKDIINSLERENRYLVEEINRLKQENERLWTTLHNIQSTFADVHARSIRPVVINFHKEQT